MKKENIRTRQFDTTRDSFTRLVEMHRLIFEGNNLQNKLVYFTHNFLEYLKSAVKSNLNDFYLLEVDGIVEGFIHYRTQDKFVFVNNLYVSKNARGNGVGGFFFKKTLQKFERYDETVLEVFLSNSNVVDWYYRMGFKEIARKSWYEFHLLPEINHVNGNFINQKDENGFESIFYENKKVATIVNNYLLVHDRIAFTDEMFSKYRVITNLELGDTTQIWKDQYGPIVQLDQTLRLKGKTKDILHYLLSYD